jgi:Clp amino terminal domain, pathogenicity island component
MISTTDPQLVTAAEAARLLGVNRRRVLELATSAPDFPSAQPTTTGGHVWPRPAVHAWAAAHPAAEPVYTGPEIPPIGQEPPQVERIVSLARDEVWALNHDTLGPNHLLLGMLHPNCPGAAPVVLASFGVRAEPLRQAFIDSMGDPFETRLPNVKIAVQPYLERANLEAVRLADPEVATEHVLLALTSPWDQGRFVIDWLTRCGISPEALRQRVVDATEGVALPELPTRLEPAPEPDLLAGLELALNPDGRHPLRRRPWTTRSILDRDGRRIMRGWSPLRCFIDRDGHPVLTADGRPVHVVVDEQGRTVRGEHGHWVLTPVEVPPGVEVPMRHRS